MKMGTFPILDFYHIILPGENSTLLLHNFVFSLPESNRRGESVSHQLPPLMCETLSSLCRGDP
jgi:hypothetical protein